MSAIRHANDVALLLKRASLPWVDRFKLIHAAPDTWCVLFEDGGVFELEWAGDWACLMLVGSLGAPHAQHERRALNMALSYNALWRETGSLRMARDSDDGSLMLIGQLDPQEIEPEAVGKALLHFEVLRRAWCDALSGEGEAPSPSAEFSLDPLERV